MAKHHFPLFCALALVCTLLQTACDPKYSDSPQQTAGGGLFITNEGKYNAGNGSLSLYDYSTGLMANDVYGTANATLTLGDVVQSCAFINNKVYVVVNNSAKIEVLNGTTYKHVGTISLSGLSPRYIIPISQDSAYVTNLSLTDSGYVSLISTKTDVVLNAKLIKNRWLEQGVKVGHNVFAGQVNQPNITVINSFTHKATQQIAVTESPRYLGLDRNGKLWAVCTGEKTTAGGVPSIVRINPITAAVEASFTFPAATTPYTAVVQYLAFNPTRDAFCYLYQNKIYKMAITDAALPASEFISNPAWVSPYGLGYDAQGFLWVADAIDYSSAGKVYRYRTNGNPDANFTVGISPNGFWVK